MIVPLLAFIDWHTFLFTLFALFACAFAAGVVFSNNIVSMAFYLTLSLGATAGLFFLAGAEFVGAMQLLIYVGGTLVLLIFGVMLTARDAFISMKTRPADWVLGVLVGGSLLALLLFAAFTVDSWRPPQDWAEQRAKISPADTQDTTRLGVALVGGRVDKQDEQDPALVDGLSGYLLPFEIISVHLLVVLIGAGYLARTKRRRTTADAAPRVRAERPAKVRAIVPSAVLAALLVGDAAAAAAGVYAMTHLDDLVMQAGQQKFDLGAMLASAPDWLLPVAVALFAVRALCLLALLCWQKWGFAAMAIISIVLPVLIAVAFKDVENLTYARIGLANAGAMLVSNLLVVGLVYALLTKLGRPTTWSQLE
jgi:NADH-quinone oxidoreductase subunit J